MKRRLLSLLSVALLIAAAADSAPAQNENPRRNARNQPAQDAPRVRPTQADVQYGPAKRNVLDFYQAKTEGRAPLLISIHGGGFRAGDKSMVAFPLEEVLDAGISVATITYRLSDEAIAPAQHHDAARAVQFLRSKAEEWKLDPERFAACGGSAGAGLSLWLAFHDDLADPESSDPVARQSTRLSTAVVVQGQSTYDPRVIREMFPGSDTYKHPALQQLYDIDIEELDRLPPEKYALFEETAAITHLSADDPPVLLSYASRMDTPITNQNIGIHHPKFGMMLKERMDRLGIECVVVTGHANRDQAPGRLEFLKKHLGVE